MDTKLLRQKILDLAIRGKLVPQDPNDEPASVLLERIKAEKEQLIKDGKIKRPKKGATTSDSRHYPFELPNCWVWCKLEDIVDYEQPTSYIVSSTEYDYSFVTPVLTAGKSFVIGRTNETNGIFSNLPCIIFDDFTTDSKYVDFPFKVKSSAMKILKVKNEISTKYVAMFMSITRLAGKTHKRYWISEYSKLRIPIPPKNEQQRILKELHKWISLIEYVEQEKVDLQSYIIQTKKKILDLAIHGKLIPQDPADEPASELLKRVNPNAEITSDNEHYPFELPSGWVWTTLGEIAESNIGLTYKPSDVTEIGIPVYRSNNIQNRKICLDNLVRVQSTILPKQYLNEGDLLICARNGSRNLVGKCALISELCEPTSFGAFMAVCRSIFNPWIYFVFNSNYFNQYLNDSNSTAIYQVTQKMLLSFLIPLPPLAEQQRIVTKIEELFTQLDNIENSLQA